MNGTIITVVGELDVEEECIMLDSQDWFTSGRASYVKRTNDNEGGVGVGANLDRIE
jgi:hypothetical protein